MTNHKARKKLVNQKWIQRSVYPCGGVSEQAFGSCCADRLYRDFVTHPAATQANNCGTVFKELFKYIDVLDVDAKTETAA